MDLYNFFLKLYGLIFLFDSVDDDTDDDRHFELKEIIISVKDDQIIQKNVRKQIPFYKNKSLLKKISLAYIILIFLNLIWQPIISVIFTIYYLNSDYITYSLFSLMYISQFIFGILYYNNNYEHFSITRTKLQNYKKYYWILLVSFILSTTIAIIEVVYHNIDVNIITYNILYNNVCYEVQIVLLILTFICKFYYYNTFFINVITFASAFLLNSMDIKKFKNDLEKVIDNDIEKLTLNSIINDYTGLKHYHSKSVDALNNMFSYVTLFGILGCYFALLNFKNNSSTLVSLIYIDIICFLIIDGIYLYSISKVKDVVGDILDIINSVKFNEIFLRREQFKNLYASGQQNNTNLSDNTVHPPLQILPSVSAASYKIEPSLININDIVIRNLIKTHENAESIDWIVLDNKLLSRWNSFNLFGFELDDTTIIQRLSTIIVGMFMIFQLNQQFSV